MLTFHINDMTCGHCVGAVTQAIHSSDPTAQVQIDLPSKTVQVETTQERAVLVSALEEAGYSAA